MPCWSGLQTLFRMEGSFAFFNFDVTENSDETNVFGYKMQLKPIFSFLFFVFLKMMLYICGHENTTSVKWNALDEMNINDWGERMKKYTVEAQTIIPVDKIPF